MKFKKYWFYQRLIHKIFYRKITIDREKKIIPGKNYHYIYEAIQYINTRLWKRYLIDDLEFFKLILKQKLNS